MRWVRIGLIAYVGACAYWSSLSGPFVFDDQLSIVDNAHIRRLWPLADVLTAERESPLAGRPFAPGSFGIQRTIHSPDRLFTAWPRSAMPSRWIPRHGPAKAGHYVQYGKIRT